MCEFVHAGRIFTFRRPMRSASEGKPRRDGLDPEIVMPASELPLGKTLSPPSRMLWGTRTMILAGDIGGTKTVIANYEESGRSLRQVRAATYHSRDYRSLEDILASYLKDSPGAAPRAGCFGVAGTVIDGKCRTTNLPWQLDE